MLSRLTCVALLSSAAGMAQGQDILVAARATGNFPETIESAVHYVGPAWAGHGYFASEHAQARGDAWDPPNTGSVANASFDQSLAEAATLRADGVARQPYRGRYYNQVGANSGFLLDYGLEIQNLSGSRLNIVLTNELHGTFAVADQGSIQISEAVLISDSTTLVAHHERHLDYSLAAGLSAGSWAPSISNTTISDVVWGNVPGYEMNAYEVYGTVGFDAHTTRVLDCVMLFNFSAIIAGADSGLAMYDFGNTAHLNVRAYDPDTGADRSSEIRVAVTVPAPASAITVAGVLAGVSFRRRRRAD